MTPEELISAAQDALGAGSPDDYKIQPTKHAVELAAKAPSLAAILRGSDLSTVAEQYEGKDTLANQNQVVFKGIANKANWAVLLTACFSALLLIVGPMKLVIGLPDSVALPILGVCGVLCGGFGSMWVYQVREGKLLDNWMGARAAAETLRTQYFEAITNLEMENSNSAIPPALLQFEYFRRYQLDVQLAFYKKRAEDHRRDADRMMRMSAYAVALASISAGLAVVLSGRHPAWVSLAALGTVATALASFAATRDSVNQSRRNAERYTNTGDALSLLKRKLDAVRTAAAVGQREPMKQFVAATHEQLSAEHRQWLATAQSIQPAIDKLDDTLSKLKPKSTEPPKTASADAPH